MYIHIYIYTYICIYIYIHIYVYIYSLGIGIDVFNHKFHSLAFSSIFEIFTHFQIFGLIPKQRGCQGIELIVIHDLFICTKLPNDELTSIHT